MQYQSMITREHFVNDRHWKGHFLPSVLIFTPVQQLLVNLVLSIIPVHSKCPWLSWG